MILVGWLLTGQISYAQCEQLRSSVLHLRQSKTLSPKLGVRKAIELQNEWLECGRESDSLFIWLQIFKGDQLRRSGQGDLAKQVINRAILLGSQSGQATYLMANAHYLSGSLYLADNQIALAKENFSKAVKQAIKSPQSRSWGVQAHVNLAYLCSSEGDYQEAIVHSEAGLQWAIPLHDAGALAELFRQKAYALYWLGNYDEATFSAQQSIKSATIAQETAMEPYFLLLGDIENKRGNVGIAVHAYQQAAAFAKRSGDKSILAVVLTNLGFLYYKQKDYPHAILCNKQALILQKNVFSRARIFDNLAACYWKIGEFDNALTTYHKGLISLPIGFKKVLSDQNPSASSIRLTLRKEVLLTLIQDKADTWLDYAKATGNDPQKLKYALNTYQVADQMIDFMRWEHVGERSKLYWRQKTRGMYKRAIETCYLLGDAEQAFRFMEKSRSVMLADKVNELGARQQLTKEQLTEEQKLQQSVSSQQEKLADLSPNNSAAYNVARMALFAKQDSLNDFLKKLETTNPAYYQYKYDNKTTSLADLQQYLKKQSSSLVTYFVGDSSLYIMSVTGNKTSLIKQPVGVYNQSLRQFSKLLADPVSMGKREDVNRFLTLSHDLYQQLLAPLTLPKGRVVVSPDGFFVPFDALCRSANKPDYAVADYAFSYVYSVGLLLKSNGSRGAMPNLTPVDFLGVAPVEFAPSLKQVVLPGSDTALEPIAGRFKASSLLTHGDATREAFLEKAANARIIHLFTHATADSTDREPSLYFTDSALQLSNLSDQALPNAEMVVLAACKTGIGADQRGEGVFSLARGFAALGVPSVLTTLWSVQNEATYELTDLFYLYLDQGLPKDIALQRAKTDWLKNAEGAGTLPNYWAGLIIVGDPKPLLHLSYSPWVAILFILAIGAIGGLRFWQKRERRSRPQLSSAHSA